MSILNELYENLHKDPSSAVKKPSKISQSVSESNNEREIILQSKIDDEKILDKILNNSDVYDALDKYTKNISLDSNEEDEQQVK